MKYLHYLKDNWAYHNIFNTYIGTHFIEFYIPALIYNLLIYNVLKFIQNKSRGILSQFSLKLIMFNHIVVLIYCGSYVHDPEYFKLWVNWNLWVPRLVYLVSLISFILSFCCVSKGNYRSILKLFSLFPTCLVLMSEGPYLILIAILMMMNFHT